MGENFMTKFPIISKYGAFKRAAILFETEDYRSSYKKLAENFDLHAIKSYFNHNYKRAE